MLKWSKWAYSVIEIPKMQTRKPLKKKLLLRDRKRKKKLEAKNKPKPVYNPPQRTPLEEAKLKMEMERLYREYHVSLIERSRRWWDEQMIQMREDKRRQARSSFRSTARSLPTKRRSSHSSRRSQRRTALPPRAAFIRY